MNKQNTFSVGQRLLWKNIESFANYTHIDEITSLTNKQFVKHTIKKIGNNAVSVGTANGVDFSVFDYQLKDANLQHGWRILRGQEAENNA